MEELLRQEGIPFFMESSIKNEEEEIDSTTNENSHQEYINGEQIKIESKPETLSQWTTFNADNFIEAEYHEDVSLPPGWTLRRSSRHLVSMKTREGRRLAGRRQALQYLIQQGHPEEDRDRMRTAMAQDGWLRDKNLPVGWIYKEVSFPCKSRPGSLARQMTILSSEGAKFNSFKLAKEFMQVSLAYDQSDVAKIDQLMKAKASKRREHFYDWLEDKDLPQGWKVKHNTNSKGSFFLSPGLHMLSGDKATLLFMIKEKYPYNDIQQMREYMITNGWNVSSNLPSNWIFYLGPSEVSLNVILLSEAGHCFESYKSAQLYLELELDKDYSVRFIEFIQEVSKQRRKDIHSDWSEDKTLPDGWKIKFNPGLKLFLSPDGEMLNCERSALQHMIKGKYCQEEVNKMKYFMRTIGWMTSTNLPAGWIYTRKFKASVIVIVSDEGVLFESFKAAQLSLELKADNEAVSNLNKFICDMTKQKRIETREKCDDEQENNLKPSNLRPNVKRNMNKSYEGNKNLPPGWLKLDGRVPFFVAPDGSQSMGRMQALKHMKDLKVSQSDIHRFIESFVEDGWEYNSFLPKTWIAKTVFHGHQKKVSLLTDQFILIQGETEIHKMLVSSKTLTEEDILGVKMFLEMLAARQREELWDWQVASTLPKGWKTRVSGKTKVLFLAPDGQQFDSRAKGLQHLTREGFSPEEVADMKRFVINNEGWEEHPNLPSDWIYKDVQSRYPRILTREGEYLHSFEAATKHMMQHNYTDSDFGNINKFQQEISKRRRVLKHMWVKSDLLPEGWKQRLSGSRLYLLSPDLSQFQGARAALKYMGSGPFSQEDRRIMEKLYQKNANHG